MRFISLFDCDLLVTVPVARFARSAMVICLVVQIGRLKEKLEDPPTVDRWSVVPPCSFMIWSETTKPVRFLDSPFGPIMTLAAVV